MNVDLLFSLAVGVFVANIVFKRFVEKWSWTDSIGVGSIAAILVLTFGLLVHP